jgi:hypothetical protein
LTCSPVTRELVAAATALSGIVAGTTVDTAVVKMAAWRRLGPRSWAHYTRGELPTSRAWYPVLGLGAVLTNVSASIAVHHDSDAAPAVLSSDVVAILAVGHLLTTAKAAPRMMQTRDTDDPAALQEALDSFRRWHLARTVIDVVTFAMNLRSLMSLVDAPPGHHRSLTRREH